MAKFQDDAKTISAGTRKLLDSIAAARKQAQEALKELRDAEHKLAELSAAAEKKKNEAAHGETPAQMNAYSSDQFESEKAQPAPEPKAEPKVEAKPEPKAEPKTEPKTETKPETKPEQADSHVRAQDRRPFRPQQGQQMRPAQGDRTMPDRTQQGDRPFNRPMGDRQQGQGDRPFRPQGDRMQGDRPFNRPQGDRQQGDRPFNRPQGDRQQGDRSFNRPQGDRPFARPQGDRQQGDRPFRPNGDRPMGDRPFRPQGDRPFGNRGPVMDKDKDAAPARPGQRPGQGNRQGGARKPGSDLLPSVEKEHVSNYDPNKKNYVRQHDPEHVAKNRKQLAKEGAGAYSIDDEYVRSGKKAKSKKAAMPKPEPVKIEKAVMTAETITVRDLSERIGKPAGEIIKKLMSLDIMATINSELNYDSALLVCDDFGIELELKLNRTAEDALNEESQEDDESKLVPRPPVITIMGHVDHGKTSLLDYIRKSRVAAGEAGGITQAIGAYTVDVRGQSITFLDTPGHEAFTAMRARGAQCTDIAVLVVAADDGVMPQTIEAINHAKAAGVPIIVAINKMDRPAADPDRIRTQLTEYNLVCEDWGGDTQMVPVSAHTGAGVEDLLDEILVRAEILELKANPDRLAKGTIVEAKLDKGRGPVATVLVQNGTLHVGDNIVAGTAYGRVRAMVNAQGKQVTEATPSTPVEVIGFNNVPDAGDSISAVDDDRLARLVAEERNQKLRAALVKNDSKASLDDLYSMIGNGVKDLNVIVKADVQGSVEAVKQSLTKLSNDEVAVKTIHGGVGAINETDVMLASASNAIIIGFNVRPDSKASALAERNQIDIRLYRVIYDAIDEITAAMKGMLAPKFKENILGHATVRQTYRISGVGTIAGSYVTDGKIQRNAQVRLLRDNVVILEGKISSLKRFKDDAKEVAQGFECGIGLENYNDVKDNDVIECFIMEEIKD